MIIDPHAVRIFTDGSCYKNPGGLSGCAAVVEYPDDWELEREQIVDHGVAESSISRMELMACNRALEWVIDQGPTLRQRRIQIITDSQYVESNIPRVAGWRSRGWRNYSGRPVENQDLWKRFLSLRMKARTTLTFHWTKGKKSQVLKEVDRAAKAAARAGNSGSDRGFRSGKVGRQKIKLAGAASLFPAKGQVAVISPYRSVVVGKSENKIRFLLYSDHAQAYVDKHYAYASPEIGLQLHRGHAYRVRFGCEPKYPIIEELVEEVTIT
jgi:ribonuclease HI